VGNGVSTLLHRSIGMNEHKASNTHSCLSWTAELTLYSL